MMIQNKLEALKSTKEALGLGDVFALGGPIGEASVGSTLDVSTLPVLGRDEI